LQQRASRKYGLRRGRQRKKIKGEEFGRGTHRKSGVKPPHSKGRLSPSASLGIKKSASTKNRSGVLLCGGEFGEGDEMAGGVADSDFA